MGTVTKTSENTTYTDYSQCELVSDARVLLAMSTREARTRISFKNSCVDGSMVSLLDNSLTSKDLLSWSNLTDGLRTKHP